MQVPEKLSLIGGSILLSSTLIFTLKSQASQVIPSVGHSISHVFDHIGDAQKASDFDDNFKQAQKNGETTGVWGTSKYYIDSDMNMHIGKGKLDGQLQNVISNQELNSISQISIDQSIQAPDNADSLFSNSPKVNRFEGLDKVDTSQTTNFNCLFSGDASLQSLDLNSWKTDKVNNVFGLVLNDHSLKDFNANGWNTENVNNSAWAFSGTTSLTSLDLSSWHIPNLYIAHNNMFNDTGLRSLNISNINTESEAWHDDVFGSGDTVSNNLQSLTLGDKSNFRGRQALPSGTWQNGDQTLSSAQLVDGNAHPGVWVKQ